MLTFVATSVYANRQACLLQPWEGDLSLDHISEAQRDGDFCQGRAPAVMFGSMLRWRRGCSLVGVGLFGGDNRQQPPWPAPLQSGRQRPL